MSEIGNIIIYIIMSGTLIGAMASVVRPEVDWAKSLLMVSIPSGRYFWRRQG
ncbi:Uncharacterised protein [Klebsiella variicola]|nr:Uncharacterised protein [Klebsiella variicola]